MRNWAIKILLGGIFLSILAPLNSVWAAQCCIYDVNSKANPPSWLSSLGPSKVFFKTIKDGENCPAPAENFEIKRFAQFYTVDIDVNDCKKNPAYKDTQTDIAASLCCINKDEGGNLKECKDRKKGDTTSCLNMWGALGSGLAGEANGISRPITKATDSCAKVPECAKASAASGASGSSSGSGGSASAPAASAPAPEAPAVDNNLAKWKQAECLAVKDKKGEQKNVWIPPKNNPNAKEGPYCFVRPLEANLEINIGTIATIRGLPKYINTVYTYALGLGILIGVVTMMFSGFQWMFSGIMSTAGAAKDRMIKAAMGLVILLGAHILLYTINPQLVQLKIPPIMAIRPDVLDTTKTDKCDPVEDSANAKCEQSLGAGAYCKPMPWYTAQKCYDAIQAFSKWSSIAISAAVLATGAAVLGPAIGGGANAVEGGSGSAVAAQGARSLLTRGAQYVGKQYVREKVFSALGGDKVLKQAGVALVIVGLAYAYDQYLKEDGEPPKGLCVVGDKSTPDLGVCRGDSDCVSGKCLTTSIRCMANKVGVCTSGQPYEPCVRDGKAPRFDCVGGAKCVGMIEKWYSGAKSDIGFCSDGSEVGMACDDSVVTCGTQGLKHLKCIKGFCRDAAFFGPAKDYIITTGKPGAYLSQYGASCFTATDCGNGEFSATVNNGGKPIPTACLKIGPDGQARQVLETATGSKNENGDLFEELQYGGICVFQKDRGLVNATSNPSFTGDLQPCFVNLGQCNDDACKKLKSTFEGLYKSDVYPKLSTTQGFLTEFPAIYKDGIGMAKVGCDNTCYVKAENFFQTNLGYVVMGQCGIPGDKSIEVEMSLVKKNDNEKISLYRVSGGSHYLGVGINDSDATKLLPNLYKALGTLSIMYQQ